VTPSARAAAVVLDEHVTALQAGLRQRGINALRVHDFRATSTLDPDVIRAVALGLDDPWVLVTMDGTIVDEYPGFEWERYAIAWVVIDGHLRGAAVEHAKAETIQRHAHQMIEQRRGDHYSYTPTSRYKHPPSLMSRRLR
jgi:hypothetical protein